jgi:hypothetical protein
VACRGDNVTVQSNDLAPTVAPRRVITPGVSPGPFRDFLFLAPRARLNAISEISAMVGRRRLVRLADFGEFNTQKLILCELPEKSPRGPGSENCSPGAHQDANVFSAATSSCGHYLDIWRHIKLGAERHLDGAPGPGQTIQTTAQSAKFPKTSPLGMLPELVNWGGWRQYPNAIVIFISEIDMARSVHRDAYRKRDLCK